MAGAVDIISRCGLRIEIHHRNQPNNKAIADGLVGQVLARLLFLKVKTKFHFKKQVINENTGTQERQNIYTK